MEVTSRYNRDRVAHMLRHAKYTNHQRVYELDVRRHSVFSQSTTTESEIILLYIIKVRMQHEHIGIYREYNVNSAN